jgi:hypothetical protein
MAGGAVTVTTTLPDTLAWLFEVAVIVAVPAVPLAVKVTDVAVAFVSVVQAAPEQVHVTPIPPSFVAVTLIVTFCPWSIARAFPPGKVRVTLELPPPPHAPIITTRIKSTHNDAAMRFIHSPQEGGPRNPNLWLSSPAEVER